MLDAASIEYGRVDQVSPAIRRVIAQNPSKFTYLGTGTYIVGRGDVVVIDPGPNLESHRRALELALEGERVRAILVTHCHADHSPLAAWLRDWSGAPTVGFGPHPRPDPDDEPEALVDTDERSGVTEEESTPGASQAGGVKVEESIDYDFEPDVVAADGDVVAEGAGFRMEAVHTPGHTSNHLCFAFAEESVLFTGDHVMGWSTTVVSPPDGDMAAYMRSLARVRDRGDAVLWPTHGPPRRDGAAYVGALIDHRLERERRIVELLRQGHSTIDELVTVLYADVRPELHTAAGRSVLAHIAKLVDEGRVEVIDGDRPRRRSQFAAR